MDISPTDKSAKSGAFIRVLVLAAALPFALLLIAFLLFPLLFALENLLIGAYPFLASVRWSHSGTIQSLYPPLNWIFTIVQWLLIAHVLAAKNRQRPASDQLILAGGVWFAVNVSVRVAFWAIGLDIVTTQVRM